jgi:hypothetical protein
MESKRLRDRKDGRMARKAAELERRATSRGFYTIESS